MTNFIPIFPLGIVVYPGESLNLHIFEERYKEMIAFCRANNRPFGIPPVLNKRTRETGTLMEIVEVVQEYENGELDIRTRGVSVFQILERMEPVPDKLYNGAIVTYPENKLEAPDTSISRLIIKEVRRLYELMNVQDKFPDLGDEVRAYEIAHLVGLSLEQEYELLTLTDELQRLEYIRRHLSNIVPVITELEAMKERIKRNGHFRNLSLDDLL